MNDFYARKRRQGCAESVVVSPRRSCLRKARALLLAVMILAPCLSASAKTVLEFEERAVVARVSPGTQIACFAVVHDRVGQRPRIIDRASLIVDDDNDGAIRIAVEEYPWNSVWMVVDLASGDYAVGRPDARELRRRPLPAAAIHRRNENNTARITSTGTSLLVWVVRPGAGAWVAEVADGTPADLDRGPYGQISFGLDDLMPVGTSAEPPADFRRDDIVAVIDPNGLFIQDGRVK